jgi:uncharacterized protein YndB with AHSA1/START domain
MKSLDVKFVCHHGPVIRHTMAGREEVAGRDVIVAHRLLKNSATTLVSERAYGLYTQACADALSIDTKAQQMVPLIEELETIGPVECWVHDLGKAWRTESERAKHEVVREKAAYLLSFDIAAPRQLVWDYFVQLDLRPKWRAADAVVEENPAGGRRGVGTTNHCMHGAKAIIEDVLEWRPFDSITITTLLPAPEAPKILMSYAFADGLNGSTRVEIRVAKPKPRDKAFVDHAAHHFAQTITAEVDVLRSMIEGGTPFDEPPPPVSLGRFIDETAPQPQS